MARRVARRVAREDSRNTNDELEEQAVRRSSRRRPGTVRGGLCSLQGVHPDARGGKDLVAAGSIRNKVRATIGKVLSETAKGEDARQVSEPGNVARAGPSTGRRSCPK